MAIKRYTTITIIIMEMVICTASSISHTQNTLMVIVWKVMQIIFRQSAEFIEISFSIDLMN